MNSMPVLTILVFISSKGSARFMSSRVKPWSKLIVFTEFTSSSVKKVSFFVRWLKQWFSSSFLLSLLIRSFVRSFVRWIICCLKICLFVSFYLSFLFVWFLNLFVCFVCLLVSRCLGRRIIELNRKSHWVTQDGWSLQDFFDKPFFAKLRVPWDSWW